MRDLKLRSHPAEGKTANPTAVQSAIRRIAGKAGFTLIELLVVISIISALASLVISSMSTARRNQRDVGRVSDIKQIQLALELYYNSNSGQYPDVLNRLLTGCGGGTQPCISPVPKDPSGAVYPYVQCDNGFHIAAALENKGNIVLRTDRDINGDVICVGDPINGALEDDNSSASCVAVAPGTGRNCYDISSPQ